MKAVRLQVRRMIQWLLAAVMLHAAVVAAQVRHETVLLDAMFQEHAVLQRDQPIRIWGRATPGHTVQVSLGTHHAQARAAQDGAWEISLRSLPAGGPYTLTASDGITTEKISDVLVGDVWLCSGQSNMELPVWRSLDAASELGNAVAPTIRLLTIPQVASVSALDRFATDLHWQAVNTGTLRDFSAACFYYARELQKTVDVPMGLINASWGGSRIQAWIGAEALQTDPLYRDALEVLALYRKDPLIAVQRWGDIWGLWWGQRPETRAGDHPWRVSDRSTEGWRKAPEALGPWERWNEPALASYNGMVWFRSVVSLSSAQAQQQAVLELGALDETDITWVNGRAVGSQYDPGSARRYPLPDGLLQQGENRIVINVLDTWREGGMGAPASAYRLRFKDGSTAALRGWEYRPAPGGESPPGAPWQSAGGVSTLHNGMVAPMGQYGLRGILWYQGESNTGGEPAEYEDLLRRLSTGWRAQFGKDLPVLLVQLAGYGEPPTSPGESGWAGIREAQRRQAARDPHTALVVALDLGDRYDIHPPNKQELGRRLARAARHRIYGEALPASGPVPVSATRERDAVVVRFDAASDALVAYGAVGPVGFELCADAVGSCQYATGEMRGRDIVLRSAVLPDATRVRYGWADNPVINLFDHAGLPVGPFEIPISQDVPHVIPPSPARSLLH